MFHISINPLPVSTFWVRGCSWPSHVDQISPLLEAFCCRLVFDALKSCHQLASPSLLLVVLYNILVLSAVLSGAELSCFQVGQQHYQKHAARWNSAKKAPYVVCKRKHYFWHNFLRQEPNATRTQMQNLPEQT